MNHPIPNPAKTGFLNGWLGGTGREDLPVYRELREIESRPFASFNLHLDTDPIPASGADAYQNSCSSSSGTACGR